MSSNRFDVLSSSDSESPTDSPTSVLDWNKRQGGNKSAKMIQEEHEVDEKDFDACVVRRLRAIKWRTWDGKQIDKEVLKKYFNDIDESEGFDINHFPGYIRGVTGIMPHFDISEDYDETMEIALTAIKAYNKKHHQSKYKVVEIKKVNTRRGGCGYFYYITFSAVHVKSENDSILHKLASISSILMIVMVTLLVWLCNVLPPYNQTRYNLKKLLLKLKSAPELKASEHELSESVCTTFQAKVWDDVLHKKRDVLLCRVRPE